MAAKKKTTSARAASGEITHDIPGGQATFTHLRRVKPRRRREVELVTQLIGPMLPTIVKAREITSGGRVVMRDPKKKGASVEMSRDDLRLLRELNDATAWACLQSWTLKAGLPETPDDMLDLDPDLYDALQLIAAKLYAADVDMTGDGFTVDSVEDENSPTGAFGGTPER